MFILTIVNRHLVHQCACVCMFACCIHCMFTSDLKKGVWGCVCCPYLLWL